MAIIFLCQSLSRQSRLFWYFFVCLYIFIFGPGIGYFNFWPHFPFRIIIFCFVGVQACECVCVCVCDRVSQHKIQLPGEKYKKVIKHTTANNIQFCSLWILLLYSVFNWFLFRTIFIAPSPSYSPSSVVPYSKRLVKLRVLKMLQSFTRPK